MKTASLPPVRVAAEFRQELESVLQEGETLSQFVEGAVRSVVEKRKYQAQFVQRGLAAIQHTQRTGTGVSADEMLARLQVRLDAAKRVHAQGR